MKVCKDPCDQCLFGKNRIVSLERKRAIERNCVAQDTTFACHKHRGGDVVCAGFLKAHPGVGNLRRISERQGWIEEVGK